MDDWPNPFSDVFEAIANEAEQFFQAVVKEASAAVEQLELASESIADQVEQVITPEIELLVNQAHQAMEPLDELIHPAIEAVTDQINQVIEPLFEIWLLDLDQESNPLAPPLDQWSAPFDPPLNQIENPWLTQHLTCVGCRNYHGQIYGNSLLVCAIHPYGPEIDQCPDRELKDPSRT